MACESEGALEVHIEPFLPAQQLVIVGRSPAVRVLTVQARALEWDVTVIDDGGTPEDHPYPESVRTTVDCSGLGVGTGTAVVIATQGHYDDIALERALETDAPYIGVVAAEKRASALRSALRERGVDDDRLARVHAPAGLDLGAVTNAEIAVAVLADLVARRASGAFGAVVDVEVHEALDPVCGMTVNIDQSRYTSEYEGVRYWFCTASCQRRFHEKPEAFAVNCVE
jgi:xanthine dehydrogenase accessory factor